MYTNHCCLGNTTMARGASRHGEAVAKRHMYSYTRFTVSLKIIYMFNYLYFITFLII